jgi:hypothetical protein
LRRATLFLFGRGLGLTVGGLTLAPGHPPLLLAVDFGAPVCGLAEILE